MPNTLTPDCEDGHAVVEVSDDGCGFASCAASPSSAGLTTGDADEAAIKRAWSQRSAETYVLGSGEVA